jgi:hypothetical protein
MYVINVLHYIYGNVINVYIHVFTYSIVLNVTLIYQWFSTVVRVPLVVHRGLSTWCCEVLKGAFRGQRVLHCMLRCLSEPRSL